MRARNRSAGSQFNERKTSDYFVRLASTSSLKIHDVKQYRENWKTNCFPFLSRKLSVEEATRRVATVEGSRSAKLR